eukprot:6195492-Pleurochrysis_carterae.AAC.2
MPSDTVTVSSDIFSSLFTRLPLQGSGAEALLRVSLKCSTMKEPFCALAWAVCASPRFLETLQFLSCVDV